MDCRKVDVKGHKKLDGTIVRQHSRIVKNSVDNDVGKDVKNGLVEGLEALVADGGNNKTVVVNGQTIPSRNTGPAGPGLTFSGLDLTGMDLGGLDLRGANFNEAKIGGVNFTGSDLRGAIFVKADFVSPLQRKGLTITDALLERSKWGNTDFISETPVDLTGITFSSSFVNFNGADVINLGNAVYSHQSEIHQANFSGQNLRGLDLREYFFRGCSFDRSDLSATRFSRVIDSSFIDAKLDETVFGEQVAGSNFKGCDLRKTKMSATLMDWCDFSDANMQGMDLSNGKIVFACNFQNTNLSQAKLGKMQFRKGRRSQNPTDFTGANLLNCDMDDIVIEKKFNDTATLKSEPIVPVVYDKFTFDQIMDELDLTPEQFEFLVVSKMVKIRNNSTHNIVNSGFDSKKNHVPFWELDRLKKILSS